MSDAGRQDFRDLVLWRKAMDLAAGTYRLSRQLPREETFALATQLRRSAVSIPSNVAEGSARRSTREFIAFLHIARGSLGELRTQCLIAERVGYLTASDLAPLERLMDDVGRLLNAVLAGLRRRL